MRKLRLKLNLSDFKGCGLFVTPHTHTHLFMVPKHPVKNSISTHTTSHQTKLTNGLSLQGHKNWLKQRKKNQSNRCFV